MEVPGNGPLSAPIWAIGESPGADEVAEGKPFVGASGRFLRNGFNRCGYADDQVRYENLIGIQPPGNHFQFWEETPERQKQLKDSVEALKERIKQAKPNIVLCLGAKPLQYIMDLRGIGDWRGHIVWSEELGCKTLATYHPSACIRQQFVEKGEYPGQYKALAWADIQKAVEECGSHDLVRPELTLITQPSYQTAMAELAELLEAKVLSIDIETLGSGVIDCIGFAPSKERAVCIPFYIPAGTGGVPYWKNKEEHKVVLQAVKEVLRSNIPKVLQNSIFDRTKIREIWQVDINNIVFDTMVMAHELYCDLPKNLGCLVSLYTKLPYHKYLIKTGHAKDRWEYNAMDAIANLHIMEGQIEEARELGVLEHYRKIANPLLTPLMEMQWRGVRVDEKLREHSLLREEQRMDGSLRVLQQALHDPEFNPGSPQQKMVLFYERFGCRKRYNKGKLSVDKDAMDHFTKDPRPFVQLVAKACMEYKEASAMAGKLKTPLREGRMHTAYDPCGTTTGRLSSKVSIFGTGTNLQNLAKGVQRAMLIPDEGEGFCSVDLWSAEAYYTALEAREQGLIEMLDSGKKPYAWIQELTQEKWGSLPEVALYDYKTAKQTILGLNYGAHPQILSQESGLPLRVTTWQYEFYHSTFPGILLRQERIKNQVRKDACLVSIFGRRRVFFAPYGDELLRQAYAYCPQSCIGELANIAITKLYWYGKVGPTWIFPALNTHDGSVIRYKLGEEEAVKQLIHKAFKIPVTLHGITLTIPVEVGWGRNFNEVKNKEILWYK